MFYLMSGGKLIAASEIIQPNGVENPRFMTEDYVVTLLALPREHYDKPIYSDGCFREKSLEAHDMVRNPAAHVRTDNPSIFALYGKMEEPKPKVTFVKTAIPPQDI